MWLFICRYFSLINIKYNWDKIEQIHKVQYCVWNFYRTLVCFSWMLTHTGKNGTRSVLVSLTYKNLFMSHKKPLDRCIHKKKIQNELPIWRWTHSLFLPLSTANSFQISSRCMSGHFDKQNRFRNVDFKNLHVLVIGR